jgi:hypothetical protein
MASPEPVIKKEDPEESADRATIDDYEEEYDDEDSECGEYYEDGDFKIKQVPQPSVIHRPLGNLFSKPQYSSP